MKSPMNHLRGTILSIFEAKRNLKLICAWEFVFCFGDGLFFFMLPVYLNQLNASPTDVGVLYAAFYLSWAVTLLTGGFLADHFDRKTILIVGSLLWIPLPIALATATDWTQLWIPMMLYGTYFGNASVCVYVLRSAPSGKTMQTFSLWVGSIALGYTFSPTLGGFLYSTIGKQAVFYIAAFFAVVSIIPIFFLNRLPKTELKESQKSARFSFTDFSFPKKLIMLCIFLQ